MPNKDSSGYIIVFSVALVLVVGLMLSLIAQLTKPFQTENIRLEKMQNILQSVNIEVTRENAEEKYNQIIVASYVIDSEGNILEGIDAFNEIDLARELKKKESEQKFPIYIANVEGSEYYILPMRGVGLWGPVWGFISIESDRNTIFGATFDHKSETPGLGAEITESFFTEAFSGKKIYDEDGTFRSVGVYKGDNSNNIHGVDIISGGTITSNGVSNMLYKFLSVFKTFSEKNPSLNVSSKSVEKTHEDEEKSKVEV